MAMFCISYLGGRMSGSFITTITCLNCNTLMSLYLGSTSPWILKLEDQSEHQFICGSCGSGISIEHKWKPQPWIGCVNSKKGEL